jgi:hypothetical protein
MQNVPLASVSDTGVLPLGCSPSATQGFLDLMDLAEVAQIVLLSPTTHKFASYELLGQNLPYSSVAEVLRREMGKPVKCEVLSMKDFAAKNGQIGAKHGEYAQDAAERMIFYFDRWSVVLAFASHQPC